MVSKVLAMLTNYFTLRYSQITICYLDVHPSCKKKIKTRDVFQCQRVQIFTAFFFFLLQITLLDQFINFTYTLNNIINILCFYGVIPRISCKTQITQY